MALSSSDVHSNSHSLFEQDSQNIATTYARANLSIIDAKGSWVTASDGKQYLDFVSGIAVNALGHGHPAVINAIEKQVKQFCHISNLFPNGPQIALAKRFLELTGWGASAGKTFFCNSGAEANEAAIKFARKYFDRKQMSRTQIITFTDSFHGRTYGALAATGQVALKQGFGPLPDGFLHLPWNDCAALKEVVSKNTCAIMLEPIAAEGGINLLSQEFVNTINTLRESWGCLVIADEIQTGLGRCGALEGAKKYGLAVDMSTWAKALGGGLPLGMVLLTNAIANELRPGDHGTTFGGNPVSCAAGLAVLEVIAQPSFLSSIDRRSLQLKKGLEDLAGDFSWLGQVRGDGLLLGIVTNKPVSELVVACRQQGMLVHRAGNNVLRLLPPLNVSEKEVEHGLACLRAACKSMEMLA